MEGEEEGGIRLSKRFSDKGGGGGGGEVDYKNKSGTAWSHSYLNQKPWHPLSYPNQRRKWIAEQVQAQRQRRTEEVSREYAQEQEFFRQTALVSKKDKEKVEIMKAVSFMYVRPPGYNAESAKAAEIADETAREHPQTQTPTPTPTPAQTDATATSTSSQRPPESMPRSGSAEQAKKSRPKDVFGRPLPTEQEFQVLKNAPRLETGVPTRSKPFGVEVRNVKCVRCGTFGHQSGDRECPLKDAVMPNEESRLKRDDPLTAILAHTDPSEPLKWELKQKPGISPPRGGFKPDDPNQQIVAEDTIFDEYGGFLSGDVIPELLTNFSSKPRIKSSKKNKHKKQQSSPVNGEEGLSSSYEDDKKLKKKMCKVNKKKHSHSESSSSEILESDRHKVKRRNKHCYSFEKSNHEKHHKSTKTKKKHSDSSEDSEIYRLRSRRDRDRCTDSSEDSEPLKHNRDAQRRRKHSFSFEDSDHEKHRRSRKIRQKHSHSYEGSKIDGHYRRDVSRDRLNNSSEGSEPDRPSKSGKSRHRHSNSSEDSDTEKQNRHRKSRDRHSYSYGETENEKHHKRTNGKHKRSLVSRWK